MNDKLVTVVVPIYNVEKYLECCLESIVNQTYKNLEIILVDDGSTDSCPQICDEWAKRDQRIRVVHKQNQGLGMARNTGIECANGAYICFFDSDDYVDLLTIEKAYEKAEQTGADISIYGFKDFMDSGEIVSVHIPKTEKAVFRGKEIQNQFLPDLIDDSFIDSRNSALPFSAWSCLFSMRLINRINWRFVSEREIISEDSYSLIALYKHVNVVCVLSEAFYFHRRNQNSLTLTFRQDRFEKIKTFLIKTVELAKSLGFDEQVISRLCGLFFKFTIAAMKQITMSDLAFASKIKCLRQITGDRLTLECLKKCRFGHSNRAKRLLQKAMLLRLSMAVYIMVYLKARKR